MSEKKRHRLGEEHHRMLGEGSGISPEIIEGRGYQTITTAKELEPLGFTRNQWRVPGLLIPLHYTDGGNGLCVFRPDRPRLNRKGDKVIKYEYPSGRKMRLDVHPICQPMLADPSITLWLTEGIKKGDSLVSRGCCAIALLGVWNWRGRNDVDGLTVLADWEHIALNGRQINIVFDSDVTRKASIRKCLDRLTRWLELKKATVGIVYLPQKGGSKVGVDDYFVGGHAVNDLEMLLEAPRPVSKAAAPIFELLEEAPKVLRRPLSLIDGKAYAAIWPWGQITRLESVNKDSEIVRHDPPMVTQEQRLIIIRGDGARFSEKEAENMPSFEDLGIDVRLPEIPQQEKLWSTGGVKRYLEGYRPEPMEVFNRVADVVDRFMSFDYSLSDQRTMAELVACYILSTYFTPALQVTGYLWPNGDFGCGKSKLLVTISELAYLGFFILAGSSYACLRDLADYGATLAFDDAENVMDKRMDPDKRTLLLAGNRRGATVTVKEQVNGKEWRTRYIDAFCPRLFSAIRLPDPVLASRTIVIPLLRTLDRSKANADPLDYTLWPHDRQELVDDLWALALAHLPELPAVDLQIAERAALTGRALEPWRAILAVALWLDEDLFTKMDALAKAYQKEKQDLETTDLSALCAEAMMELAKKPALWEGGRLKFTVSRLGEIVTRLAIDMDRHSGDEPYATPQRIGVTLTKMRIAKGREDNPGRSRYRSVDWTMLERLGQTYPWLTCPTRPNMSTCPSEEGHRDNSGQEGQVEQGVEAIKSAGQVDNSGHAGHDEQRVCGHRFCFYNHTAYWKRPDGSRVCAICHPPPAGVEVFSEIERQRIYDDPRVQAALKLGGEVSNVISLEDGTTMPF